MQDLIAEEASRGKRKRNQVPDQEQEKNPVDEDKAPNHSVFIFWLIFVQ
jgi:hypothetical protein